MIEEFTFSKASKKALRTCHADLKLIMNAAISMTTVDFGISEGHRSIERQKALFDLGKSKIDGITRKGKHNYDPSEACDIFAYVDGKANYSDKNMAYLAGMIILISKQLYGSGKITHQIRCGINWGHWENGVDYNGFIDAVHYEII